MLGRARRRSLRKTSEFVASNPASRGGSVSAGLGNLINNEPLQLAQADRIQGCLIRELSNAITSRIVIRRFLQMADDLENPIPLGRCDGSCFILEEDDRLGHGQKGFKRLQSEGFN